MQQNVGLVDRMLRIVIGLAMFSILFFATAPDKYWGLLGLIPLATGIFGICPIYSLLGIRSCPWRK